VPGRAWHISDGTTTSHNGQPHGNQKEPPREIKKNGCVP
jgi:hypothetical protein